jgi:Cu-Zn family superoxide dismutase
VLQRRTAPLLAAFALTAAAGVTTTEASAQQATTGAGGPPTAEASFIDAQGKEIGTAVLTETPHGVLIQVDIRGLPPGPHGFHIHENGTCEGPSFQSAGGHYAGGGGNHGFHNEDIHVGDLPNVTVQDDGVLVHDVLATEVTLSGEDLLLDRNGSALVIHAQPDDYRTAPSGSSGDRIACAAIGGTG